MAVTESTYYSEGNVLVTNARVVLGSKTYSMANVSSVSIGEVPANKMPAIALIVVGALIAMCSLGVSQAIGGVIVGLLLVGLGIFAFMRIKPKFVVRLGSASGETDGLVSEDRSYVEKVVKAINEAIVRRG